MKNLAIIFILALSLGSCASHQFGCPYTDYQAPTQKAEQEILVSFEKPTEAIVAHKESEFSEIIICE